MPPFPGCHKFAINMKDGDRCGRCPDCVEDAKARNVYSFTEAEMLLIKDSNYQLGQAVSLEALSKKLLAKAGEEFTLRHDEQARWYRDLALSVASTATEHRQKHREIGGGAFRVGLSGR